MTSPVLTQALEAHIREAGGIVHSDGNIFFTNAEKFQRAAIASLRAADAGVPPLAADHTGMRVDYSGMLRQAREALQMRDAGRMHAEMLRQLQAHLKEMGERFYAGDVAAVDEFLQLYCVAREQRPTLSASPAAPAPQPAQREGWFLPLDAINSIQDESIGRLVKRARGAHHADVDLRINGQNERHQADWIKHMERAAPEPQAAMDAAAANGLAWAVHRWQEAVKYCPMVNVHRRALDDTWREVIRYFGGNPDKLVGPRHDKLLLKEKRDGR